MKVSWAIKALIWLKYVIEHFFGGYAIRDWVRPSNSLSSLSQADAAFLKSRARADSIHSKAYTRRTVNHVHGLRFRAAGKK